MVLWPRGELGLHDVWFSRRALAPGPQVSGTARHASFMKKTCLFKLLLLRPQAVLTLISAALAWSCSQRHMFPLCVLCFDPVCTFSSECSISPPLLYPHGCRNQTPLWINPRELCWECTSPRCCRGIRFRGSHGGVWEWYSNTILEASDGGGSTTTL